MAKKLIVGTFTLAAGSTINYNSLKLACFLDGAEPSDYSGPEDYQRTAKIDPQTYHLVVDADEFGNILDGRVYVALDGIDLGDLPGRSYGSRPVRVGWNPESGEQP